MLCFRRVVMRRDRRRPGAAAVARPRQQQRVRLGIFTVLLVPVRDQPAVAGRTHGRHIRGIGHKVRADATTRGSDHPDAVRSANFSEVRAFARSSQLEDRSLAVHGQLRRRGRAAHGRRQWFDCQRPICEGIRRLRCRRFPASAEGETAGDERPRGKLRGGRARIPPPAEMRRLTPASRITIRPVHMAVMLPLSNHHGRAEPPRLRCAASAATRRRPHRQSAIATERTR